MHGVRFILIVLAAAVLSRELAAQSAQPISLQGSVVFNGVFGRVFTGLQDGIGAEAQIRYTPSAFSIGAGFQYTTHDLEGQADDARLYGGFVEPRYRIRTGSNVVAPYVAARFALLKIGFSSGNFDLTSSFIQLNGGGGLLVRLGPRVNLDVGATFGHNHLSDGTLTNKTSGTSVRVGSGSGSNIIARLGLALGLGG
jgi:hypothetical protein